MGKNNHTGKIIGVLCPMLGLALGEYIPLCYMQDAFKAFYAERITGNMANASMELINTPIVVVLTIVTIICAILGYLWGEKIAAKRLAKGGSDNGKRK